jgi:hypothetical protein
LSCFELEMPVLAFLWEAVEDPLVSVKDVIAAAPFGVSIAGLNDAVVPAGSPDTLKEIGLGKPFAVGVTVI